MQQDLGVYSNMFEEHYTICSLSETQQSLFFVCDLVNRQMRALETGDIVAIQEFGYDARNWLLTQLMTCRKRPGFK